MDNNLIYIKKFNGVDNSIICFLNSDTDNLKLNFAEVYNNGYNTNNFNIYSNNSMMLNNSVADYKFNYLNDNIEYLSLLNRLTEIYSKIIMHYKKANYYILKNKKTVMNLYIL